MRYARVLVVDDMQTNLDVTEGLLRKYKMQVDCVLSGYEAVERIRHGKPEYSAVFMDHMMPGMDGIETADAIRALESEYARSIPIIALTANAIHGTENVFYAHDFQAFITKPIDIMLLDTVVCKWVRNEALEKSAAASAPAEEPAGAGEAEIAIAGLDAERGLALYADETDIYINALRSYAANTPEALEKMREVTVESLEGYAIVVHGVKGVSANVGAVETVRAAGRLELLARSSDLDGVLALNDAFIRDTLNIVANITSWLENHDAE